MNTNNSVSQLEAISAKEIFKSSYPGVTCGLCKDGNNYAIAVRFASKAEADNANLPSHVGFVKLVVEITGGVVAL